MKAKQIAKTIILYVVAITVMAFTGWKLQTARVYADEGGCAGTGGCCTYGNDCSADKCCLPGRGEANCSATCANYCRASCS